jgi:hypothetical protein
VLGDLLSSALTLASHDASLLGDPERGGTRHLEQRASIVAARDTPAHSGLGLSVTGMRVTNQHKQRLAADESYLAQGATVTVS